MKLKTVEELLELRNQALFAGGSHEDAKGYWKMNSINIADFALSLHAQLQQEREAREAAESWIPVHDMVRNELHDLLADLWYEFTIPNSTGGRDAREYAVLVRTEEVLRSAGVLDAEGRYIRAALARPEQEQAGEGTP